MSGEAGIGKSALLEAVVDLASDFRVLRCSGRQAESDLAWAALGELLAPLLVEAGLDALTPARRSALLAAVAVEEVDRALEAYAVVSGAFDLVRAAAVAEPLVVVVDDAHWLDEPSRLAVRFLIERCAGLPVAVVVASRPGDDRPDLLLGPLADPDADRLLVDLGVSSPTARALLVDELAGVPLLLRAAVEALEPGVLTGSRPVPEALPVPPSALRWAEDQVSAASNPGRTALLVASTSPDRDVATVQRALAAFGAPPSALEAAEQDGLVEIVGGLVTVRHPTLRSAVLAGASPADRRAAHGAVADALADPVIRCWHRGLSLAVPDESVAAELERQAHLVARRGARMAAARYLELAARVSPSPVAAARRLRMAAEAAIDGGRDDAAEVLLTRAEAAGGDEREGWHCRRIRLALARRVGEAGTETAALRALADEVAEDEPGLAAEVLLDALPALALAMDVAEARLVAEEAAGLAAIAGDGRLARRADVALGAALFALGDTEGPPRLARYREVLEEEGAVRAAPFLMEVVAPCLTFFEREPELDALFAALEEDLRSEGVATVLIQVLAARAMACHRRDLPRAASLAQEAFDLAATIDRPGLATVAAAELASSTALIGDRERCGAAVDWLLATGVPGLRQAARTSLGVLHLAEGDLDGAMEVFEAQRDEAGLCGGLVRWEIDWCEALVLARRSEEALQILEAVVATDQALLGAGGFTRIRALLAEDLDEAEALFATARDWFRLVGNRTGEGRTELLWGERLRRARRRGVAREHLALALELFEGTGAAVWAQRARRELAAAGGVRTVDSVGVTALTEQELVVARLAVAGSSNQDIGRVVHLSPRTVETHLGAVYRKLGVRNRRELSALAVEERALRG